MNVNLWGPDLWALLHGVVGIGSYGEKKNEALVNLLSSLRVLLPCIHCRRSFNEFYSEKEFEQRIFENMETGAIEYVYNLHNQVNDKLENQKLDKLFEAVPEINNELRNLIKQNYLIVSGRPTLTVVKKRLELSEGQPFCTKIIWNILYAFVLCLQFESEEECTKKVENLKLFVHNLSLIFRQSFQYKTFGNTQLQKLNEVLLAETTKKTLLSSYDLFFIISSIRMQTTFSESTKTLEKIWIDILWKKYMNTMPAGSCSKFTCA